MRNHFLIIAILLSLQISAQPKITQEHKDRAAEIVAQMTLEEKIAYVGGYEDWYIRPVERLGLPAIKMVDGPQGVRNNTRSTLYPSGVAAASTWDRELIGLMGIALGQDARARGVHVLLGPGANIYRSPMCGRNFEYLGEDPYLSGEMAASYIKGLQSQGVIATIKHFAGNNQEYDRHNVSSDIDERTLHEIYFPAFEKAVKEAGVASVMTSYNLLNGVHSSESKYLNYDVLRELWGFDGFVMSDWVSCYSPLNVATWGVDIEMPSPQCMDPELIRQHVLNGTLDERYIDRKCQHIIQTLLAFEFDRRPQLDESIPLDNPFSDSVACEISRAAVVMLKNEDGFLPFVKGNVLVCGQNAEKVVTGGGSGFVTPLVSTSISQGMGMMGRKIKTVTVSHNVKDRLDGMFADKELTEPGVKVEMFANINLEGTPVQTYLAEKVYFSGLAEEAHVDLDALNMSSRHTFYYKAAKDEELLLKLNGNDGHRMYINGELLCEEWKGKVSWQNSQFHYRFESGKVYEFVIEHFNDRGNVGLDLTFEMEPFAAPDELKALKEADCVVVCLGFDSTTERENSDRTFDLPRGQEEYLRAVLRHNENVVVVLNGGGGVKMGSWIDDVKSVLMAWYPGQQGGLAISEIITGKVNPSGKLPMTLEKAFEDNPVYGNYYENVPRMRGVNNPYSRVEYREGLFVGYRGYEKDGVEPMFPFGFGLSYTSFGYSDLAVEKDGDDCIVSFTVTNTGKVAGAEVAQIYVTDEECYLQRPIKELKGFEKIFLEPGEAGKVRLRLSDEAFRFYDPYKHEFVVEPGMFTIHVGASSRDIRLKMSVSR